jgi:hypothetical protein
VFERLTGQDAPPAIRPNGRDQLHFYISRRAITWPVIQRLAARLARDRICTRYSCGTSPFIVNAYRIRALGGMIRNRFRRARRGRELNSARPRSG